MKICRRVLNICQRDGYVSVMTNCVELRIWFMTDWIVRIRAGFDGDFAEGSYSLTMTAWEDPMDSLMQAYRKRVEPAKAVLTDEGAKTVLQGKHLKVVVEKEPFRLAIYDEEETVLHRDIVELGYQEDSNHRRIHTSEISPEDCFYGFGEKTGEWNKAQRYMSMSPKDAMGYDPRETDSLYKHIPFYIKANKITKKAVGYFYHNMAECDFDMGREKSNYWNMHSRYRTDAGDIDLFFIAGPSIRQVVERYTDLTGKSAMLPRTALGYLGSSMYYAELEENCDDAIVQFIDTTKEEDIPVDGFQLSSGYTSQDTEQGLKRCVFTWNEKRFKDPKQFFARMKERGIMVSPNVKPGILLVHPRLEEMKAKGIFVTDSESDKPGVGTWWGGPGVFVDFTKPEARKVWKEMLKDAVLDMGTSSVWNDNCEYDSIVDKDCRCDFEGKGITVGQIKAAMSNLMCHVTAEAIGETFPNVRPFIVCRSGHAGIQRYAQTWAGDNLTCWESLKYNIGTILGMGLSGVANQGCDIGGFYGPSPEPELMARWVQNGIFQPRFSVHSVNTDNTVTEPWMYGSYTGYIRDAIKLRYRLIPYLYSLMARAHETGLPIMEPMCSAFQQDSRCYEEGVDFMVGDSLLVANVVEKGAKTRRVYLPEGETFYALSLGEGRMRAPIWGGVKECLNEDSLPPGECRMLALPETYVKGCRDGYDVRARMAYEGGQTIEFPVDMGSIPMFMRSGAIIPMALNQIDNLATQQVTGIYFLCAPDRDSRFTLYEDDGITMDYEKGVYLKTYIQVKAGMRTVLAFRHEGIYETAVEQMYIDAVHREKAPFWVKADGRKLPRFLHRKKFEAADEGWYYSQTLKSVQIKYANPKKDYEVVISFEEFDMIGM